MTLVKAIIIAEYFLSLGEDILLSTMVGVCVSYLAGWESDGIQEAVLHFKHFWETLMPVSYGMKSHKCQGLSLLWASGEDEWLFRPIGECSAGLWFPFCVKFGQEPKWQARTAYHDRVWSHAFPMLSHTKQWGLPQLALSPLQLPPPVHVLALCHCTKPPFSSPRFLHMGNHYQMRTLCLRVLFFGLFICLLSSFCLLSFFQSLPYNGFVPGPRRRVCAYTALCPVVP